MFLPDKKMIFIHIDRCGGTSVEKAFDYRPEKRRPQEHLTLSETIERYNIPCDDLHKYFIWGVVRNPFDKMVSHYFHKRQNFEDRPGRKNRFDIRTAEENSFNDWLKTAYNNLDKLNINMFTNQIDWFKYNGKVYDSAYMIHFEYFYKIPEILSVTGINIKPGHLNKSVHEDYKKYYNLNSIQLIEKHFRKDLEHFGYRF